jgi:signal transduction histidine kinase
MSRKEIRQEAGEHPLLLVRLNQEAQRRYYVANLPWWRHPLIGYLASVPLIALAMMIPLGLKQMLLQDYFPSAPLFVVTVIIALTWGTGPAIFSILLGTVTLDYFFISHNADFSIRNLRDVLPYIPFLVAELIIALIVAQKEAARRRAFIAEQNMILHAEELERTNKQLQDANQLKNQFVSMASHELKTPITSIRGQAQVALRRMKKQKELSGELEPVYSSLEKIDEQTHRLQALVDDLLDMSAIQAGKINLRLKRCDLNELCERIVSEQRQLSGRDIKLSLPEKALILRVDGERVGQVLVNLLTNAIKYSPEGSVVKIRVGKQAEGVRIEVHNEGVPIAKEQQEHLFEIFYRASNAQSSSKQGWGLGLAICKDIVERHEGKIWVESCEERGTSFFVELPLTAVV